jgi:hypothetical protein
VAVSLTVNDAFINYRSGIFNAPCATDVGSINHAMLLVGYGTQNGMPFWTLKNSYGTGWVSWNFTCYRKQQRSFDLLASGWSSVHRVVPNT